jgi:hypothetical protein
MKVHWLFIPAAALGGIALGLIYLEVCLRRALPSDTEVEDWERRIDQLLQTYGPNPVK